MKPSFHAMRLAAFAALSFLSFHAQAQEGSGGGVGSASGAGSAAAADKPLSTYRDKNRVLLVFAASEGDAAYKEQTKLWQGERAEFQDRQLVVVPVLADAKKAADETPATLEKKYGVEAKAFAVVLLGKDGHDAYRASKPVSGPTLYGVIDAMPMRKAEMKRGQQSAASGGSGGGTPVQGGATGAGSAAANANAGLTPAAVPRPTPAKPDLDHDE